MAAHATRLVWRDVQLEAIDLPKAKLQLTLGLGSGLTRRSGDAPGRVFAVTDRGPNLFLSQAMDDYGLASLEAVHGIRDAKVMPKPECGPEIVELSVDAHEVRLVQRLPLRTRSGLRLSGAAPAGSEMEAIFGLDGRPIAPAPLGADTEAIAVMPDGSFFLSEEYGPSLLKADAGGVVTERWVAPGREGAVLHQDLCVRAVLPEAVSRRRLNRGLEALAASPCGRWLYLGLQSAPAGFADGAVPIWKLDAETGALAGEWRYPFDAPSAFKRDAERRKVGSGDPKVCEFAWAGDDRLVVLERIAHSTKLYLADLARLPDKELLVSSDELVEIGPDMEGMTILSPTELLLASDNDFGVEGAPTEFWRLVIDRPL